MTDRATRARPARPGARPPAGTPPHPNGSHFVARTVESTRPRVRVGGMWFDNVTMEQAIARIDALVRARRPALVVTPNVDHVIFRQSDREYADLVARADLVLADGQPIVWGARVLGTPLPERVAGSDLFPRLCAHAASRSYRVFFLGGAPGAAASARTVLRRLHPRLRVVGTYCPPYGFDQDPTQNCLAVDAVRAARPQIVFVGLGSPKQEHWIARHMHEYGPAVSVGVGISFSFVAGHVKRAPRWMQRAGLEWLHRVVMEPRRLAGRYFLRSWRLLPIVLSDLAASWSVAQRWTRHPPVT